MKNLVLLFLFIPFGSFAQQNGDNTVLIQTPYSAKENFIRFGQHLTLNDITFQSNVDFNFFITEKDYMNSRIISNLHVFCFDSLIVVRPYMAILTTTSAASITSELILQEWVYSDKNNAWTRVTESFLPIIKGFGYQITFEKR